MWRMCTEQLVPVPRGEGVETQMMDAKRIEICTCECKGNRNAHVCWSWSPGLVLHFLFFGCLNCDGIKVPKTPCLDKRQANSLRSFREGSLVLHWTFFSSLQSLEFCFPPDKLCAFWQTSAKCCEMQQLFLRSPSCISNWDLVGNPKYTPCSVCQLSGELLMPVCAVSRF